jgi:hypothetical protein
MINPLLPLARLPLKQIIRRLDAVAADLNVLLVVFALGLAVLDVTFVVTQKVVDHLPPISRLNPDQPATTGE